jgi:hypothetical protein
VQRHAIKNNLVRSCKSALTAVKTVFANGCHVAPIIAQGAGVVIWPNTATPVQIPFHAQVELMTAPNEIGHVGESRAVDLWPPILVVLPDATRCPAL